MVEAAAARQRNRRIHRRQAETILYDQPYEDKSASASPARSRSRACRRTDVWRQQTKTRPATERAGETADTGGDFVHVILDNLRKAGVQNTVKNERLIFDRLDAFPGEYIQAEGDIQPRTASRSAWRVRHRAGVRHGRPGACARRPPRKRSRAVGCDLLLVCGFAFDPHVSEQTQELKKEAVRQAADRRA